MGVRFPKAELVSHQCAYILRGAKKIRVIRDQKKVDTESVSQGATLLGYYDEWDCALYITEEPITEDVLKDIVCHELIHAWIDDSPLRKILGDNEEAVCNLFGAAIFELVRRNHDFVTWLQSGGHEIVDE
jgi:hypothetical protein